MHCLCKDEKREEISRYTTEKERRDKMAEIIETRQQTVRFIGRV